ncbi:MAG: YgiT-type zinc finger protein [Calditrichota bacterium]
MKCVICKGDDIRVTKVNEELSSGTDIVLFPVTIPVCQTCGERYYDRRTMEALEEVARKLRENRLIARKIGSVLEAV